MSFDYPASKAQAYVKPSSKMADRVYNGQSGEARVEGGWAGWPIGALHFSRDWFFINIKFIVATATPSKFVVL